MLTTRVVSPGSTGSLRSANFFNGRLLVADDLRVEQESNQQQHQWLARALGAGIVSGLEVQVGATAPGGGTLTVAPGLGYNRRGQPLYLNDPVTLALQAEAPRGDWQPYSPEGPAAPAFEAYVLLAGPASYSEGQTPRSAFGSGGQLTGTAVRYLVSGLDFRLAPLQLPALPAGRAMLRSWVAHLCLGTREWLMTPPGTTAPDPGASGTTAQGTGAPATAARGGLSRLCPSLKPEVDLPLALLGWAERQLQFLDLWSVRRRLQAATPAPFDFGAGRQVLTEALCRQFQAQIAAMQTPGVPLRIAAGSYFQYLPPTGYLPLGDGGFDPDAFFTGLMTETAELDPAFLRLRVQQAWLADPIDVAAPAPLQLFQPVGQPLLFFWRRDQAEPQRVAGPTAVAPAPASVSVEVLQPEGGPLPPELLRVYAADEGGREHPAEPAAQQYLLRALPVGSYTVWAVARDRLTAGQRITVTGGPTLLVRLTLAPAPLEAPAAVPPAASEPERWEQPEWFGKLVLRQVQLLAGPQPVLGWHRIDAFPALARAWLRAWAAWLVARQPTLPVDAENVRLLVDPAFTPTPGVTVEQCRAYVVYGDGGAYLPVDLVALTPQQQAPAEPGLLTPEPPAQTRGEALGEAATGVLTEPRRGLVTRFWSFFLEFLGFPPRD